MNLTYIANIRMPTEKAHGIQIMKMCEAFARSGYDVELVVPERKNPILADPFDYYGVERNFRIRRTWSLDLVRLGKIGFLIQSLTFAQSTALRFAMRGGLFYTRDELIAFYLAVLGKRVGWEVHMGQENMFAKLLVRLRVPIVTITHALERKYISLGARKVLTEHDAVDPASFAELPSRREARQRLELPEERTIIGYIGKLKTLGRTKGVEAVVAPFKKLYASYPKAFLLIVGPEADEVQDLARIIKEHSIPSDAYRIIGHVSHSDAPLYMRACDVLLMLYPNTVHYAYYMSPLKLFEYMASGTSILASDLPSLREVLNEKSAYFFSPDDAGHLESQLITITRDEREREKRAAVAAEDMKHYTWQKRARSILAFIEQ